MSIQQYAKAHGSAVQPNGPSHVCVVVNHGSFDQAATAIRDHVVPGAVVTIHSDGWSKLSVKK